MNAVAGGLLHRLRAWFPDREFFMRSQGQVRFIKITSRMQMIAAGVVLAALVAWGLSMAVMGWLQYRAAADRMSLLEREAKVSSAEERVGVYRHDIDAVADDLKRRQTFIEEMVDSLPADVRDGETVTNSAGEAGKTIDKVSAMIPEAAALARIEARQLDFVEKLTRYADRRAERSARAIRQLGLDPNAMVRAAGREAMGGPFERLSTGRDGSIDPRFERLGLSLARMEALDTSLAGIPQYLPAKVELVMSLNDPAVPAIAARLKTTRSAAAADLWRPRLAGAVVVIGNAPTALFRLLDLLAEGAPKPAAIIATPVGFVGAAEAKAQLALDVAQVPFLTLLGRRGGSAIAGAALNAILRNIAA